MARNQLYRSVGSTADPIGLLAGDFAAEMTATITQQTQGLFDVSLARNEKKQVFEKKQSAKLSQKQRFEARYIKAKIRSGFVLTNGVNSPLREAFLEFEELFVFHATTHSSKTDKNQLLKDLTGHLIKLTYDLCDVDVTQNTVYCLNLISQIRICLRVLVLRKTSQFISIIDRLLVKITTIEQHIAFKKLSFCLYARNDDNTKDYDSMSQKDMIFYLPHVDEPLHSVLHFNKLHAREVTKSLKLGKDASTVTVSYGFELTNCGSSHVNGIYTPDFEASLPSSTPSNTANTDPLEIITNSTPKKPKQQSFVYKSSNGCVITRRTYKFHTVPAIDDLKSIYEPPCVTTVYPSTVFYAWQIINSATARNSSSRANNAGRSRSVFYNCVTVVDNEFPPQTGWQPTRLGLLPIPTVTMVPLDNTAADGGGSGLTKQRSRVVKSEFPLQEDQFPTVPSSQAVSRGSKAIPISGDDGNSSKYVLKPLRRSSALPESFGDSNTNNVTPATPVSTTDSTQCQQSSLVVQRLKSARMAKRRHRVAVDSFLSDDTVDFSTPYDAGVGAIATDVDAGCEQDMSRSFRSPLNDSHSGRIRASMIMPGDSKRDNEKINDLFDIILTKLDFSSTFLPPTTDTVNQANETDTTVPPYSSGHNNPVMKHCNTVSEQVNRAKRILEFKRQWVESADVNNLLSGQPPLTTALIHICTDRAADNDDAQALIEAGGDKADAATASLSIQRLQNSELYRQIFNPSRELNQQQQEQELDDQKQQEQQEDDDDRCFNEQWNLSTLVTKYSLDFIKERNSPSYRRQQQQQGKHPQFSSPGSFVTALTPTRSSQNSYNTSRNDSDGTSLMDIFSKSVAPVFLSPASANNSGGIGMEEPHKHHTMSRKSRGDRESPPPRRYQRNISLNNPSTTSLHPHYGLLAASHSDTELSTHSARADQQHSQQVQERGGDMPPQLSRRRPVNDTISHLPTRNRMPRPVNSPSNHSATFTSGYPEQHRYNMEQTRTMLADLCESAYPTAARSGTADKCKVSILGVEVESCQTNGRVSGKLMYVIRVWLNDVRQQHTYTRETGSAELLLESHTNKNSNNSSSNIKSSTSILDLELSASSADELCPPPEPQSQSRLSPSPLQPSLPADNNDNHAGTESGTAYCHPQTIADVDTGVDVFDTDPSSRDSSNIHSSTVLPQLSADRAPKQPHSFQEFTQTIASRSTAAARGESWSVFTVKRSLENIGALHAELMALLHDTDQALPEFPDAYEIGQIEDKMLQRMLKNSTPSKRKKSVPFLYHKNLKLQHNPLEQCKSSGLTSESTGPIMSIDDVMCILSEYIESVFAKVSSVDAVDDSVSCGDHKHPAPTQGTASLQTAQATAETVETETKLLTIAPKLSQLIGRFLCNDAIVNIISSSARSAQSHSSAQLSHHAPVGKSPVPVLKLNNMNSSSQVAKDTNPIGSATSLFTAHHVHSSDNGVHEKNRPIWYPHCHTAIKLRVDFRLSSAVAMKSDADLLRIQRSKCLGCGTALTSDLLGFDCNYFSCRYFGGLFCKRWCHGGESRPIPVRVLQYWDIKPYKVCNQAATFIDHITNKPVLNLSKLNPLLFESVSQFQQISQLRWNISELIEQIVKHDSVGVKLCVVNTMGKEKAYLCVADDIFSPHDVQNVENGELLINLQNLYNGLLLVRKGLLRRGVD